MSTRVYSPFVDRLIVEIRKRCANDPGGACSSTEIPIPRWQIELLLDMIDQRDDAIERADKVFEAFGGLVKLSS